MGSLDADLGPREMPADAVRLGMCRHRAEPPEAVALPAGCVLRTFDPGDHDALCRLLETGVFGTWDAGRLAALFESTVDHLTPDRTHLAVMDGKLVGHCCLMVRDSPDGPVGKLGWVVVHPDWRGHGIGRSVCVAALRTAARFGLDTVVLDTEDFRGEAIALYLSLGFAPVRGVDPAADAWWDRHA